MIRRPRFALHASLLLLLAVLAAAAAFADAPARAAAPVRLVETRPVESALGDPALPTALDTWLGLIRGARESLDIEQFYLSTWPGEPMEQVLDALGELRSQAVDIHDNDPET